LVVAVEMLRLLHRLDLLLEVEAVLSMNSLELV
jgi:hypothetical protein